ncbi:TonB family protein [Rhodalgimonas zhirmunskyi]|uniref:TonB family protein n=1 Tax=Rhodalgimonas zhirmunskyi TaxID=2964767 RepID=A0AAJ1X4R4_9RHOB|nr:TonB family protein [Rhodoalgimonas zhirmunskyi]MDQ2093379.1 TonB family protein [Rhodoalgimonas zhirmunskyi]
MRSVFEFAGFAAIALAAHVALWPQEQVDGAEASGAGGDALLSIKAASASVETMVETWETPPEVAEANPQAISAPEADAQPDVVQERAPEMVALAKPKTLDPHAAQDAPAMPQYQDRAPQKMQAAPELAPTRPAPQADVAPETAQEVAPVQMQLAALPPAISSPTAPALPSVQAPATPQEKEPHMGGAPPESRRPALRPAELAAEVVKPQKTVKTPAAKKPAAKKPAVKKKAAAPAPKKKATPAKTAQPSSAGTAARVAKGTGGGQAKGNAGQARSATLSKSKKNSLLSQWGGQIRSRIARRAPRAAGRGTAYVLITVSGNGGLIGVQLAKSSGNARIDKLAVAAVKSAGRFPAAPKALGISRHTFRLPIKSR